MSGRIVMQAFLLLCAAAAGSAAAAPRERQQQALTVPRVIVAGHEATPKPTAPIAVSYELDDTPALGLPVTVRIVAQPAEELTDLTIELTADDALFLGPIARGTGAGPGEHVWTVTVTPVREGLGHLNVSITGRLNGTDQTRSLLIPIRTAAPAGGAPSTSKATDDEERVISLPAEETLTR